MNSGSISSMAAGDRQVAVRAGQVAAGHPLGVDRVAFQRVPAGQEPLLALRAQERIAEQVDVLRDPQDFFGRKVSQQCGHVTWGSSLSGVIAPAES